MIFKNAKKLARELDWHKTNDGVFGLYKGYFFNVANSSLLSNPPLKFVSATTDQLTEQQKQQIKTALDSNKKNLKFNSFEINENGIFIQFIETFNTAKLKTTYSLLDYLVELFKKLNIPEQNNCHNCRTKERINYYDLNHTGIILCKTCFNQLDNDFKEIERKRISEEKNYVLGFLGSILFSIPGIIVWVLIAVYLERLASGMALIIAFLGLKGYEYFKGRQGKLTKYLIVLTNILSILIANIVTVVALLVREGLSINEAFIVFQTNQAAKDLFNENTIISFILALIVWIWLLFIVKDNKLSIKLADKIAR